MGTGQTGGDDVAVCREVLRVSEPDLKPCPFCGGEATVREYAHGHAGSGEFTASYEVKCPDCQIRFQFDSHFSLVNGQPVFKQNGYEKCVEAWNRRVSNEKA